MSILNYFSAEESQEPVVSAPLLQTTKEMQIVTETVEKAVKDKGSYVENTTLIPQRIELRLASMPPKTAPLMLLGIFPS